MITPDGRVLHNLDEFMLRLGHVTVACKAAAEVGGSTYRVTAELSERLIRSTTVPKSSEQAVASYLRAKSLCRSTADKASSVSYRYPEIVVTGEKERLRLTAESGHEPHVWWQDLMLSEAQVRSRVGGVTVSAKGGSKSGLSHILDWASLLDLVTSTGDLTADGRLIASTASQANPYVLGAERIVYGWHYLQADFDVASKILLRCSETRQSLKKREATALFVDCLEGALVEAEKNKRLSSRQYDVIYNALSELQRTADKAGKTVAETSTAWHRASSRFETLVDLGLLDKATSDGKYTYLYRGSDHLGQVSASLVASAGVEDWFENHFLSCMLPELVAVEASLSDEILVRALDLLGSGSSLVGIDSLILALSVCLAQDQQVASVAAWRSEIVKLTRNRPDVARLSAGRYGSRAEFVSIRKLKLGS